MSLYFCCFFVSIQSFGSRISIGFCLCRIVEGFVGVDGRKLDAASEVMLVSMCILSINKYIIYKALVCSHCNDGRGMATSAVFAMCRLSLSFLVYSPSHYSLHTRYHAGTVERWAALFLAWADKRLARGHVHEYRRAWATWR